MNIPESVKIFIFNSKINWDDYDCTQSHVGDEISTTENILVNKVDDGYSIVYMDDVFEELNVQEFLDSFIQLFSTNLPGKQIQVDIRYFPLDDFSEDCGKCILDLDNLFRECEDDNIEYLTSPSVAQLIEGFDEETNEFDFNEDDDEDIDIDDIFSYIDPDDLDDDDDEDYYSDYDTNDILNEYLGRNKKRYKDDKPMIYKRSRLIRSSKIRKTIKRHGVIVSSDKSAKKKDAETIAKFLKDFIPGKEYRNFRKKILHRWMDTLVISKRFAKKLQKAHENKANKKSRKKNKATQGRILDITSRMFGGYDLFSDPNR